MAKPGASERVRQDVEAEAVAYARAELYRPGAKVIAFKRDPVVYGTALLLMEDGNGTWAMLYRAFEGITEDSLNRSDFDRN